MGDFAPPPLAAASLNDELPFHISESTVATPAGSGETVPPPHLTSAKQIQPQMRRGNAIFSTDLGMRAPRKVQGPPYTPVIARSNIVFDVVSAAGFWRGKYPYQYFSIFPHAGWKINDLWDDEDIHVETESFCKEVLQFIERDNAVRAERYAQDWTKLYPERLSILGGDIAELYDKSNPLSIVDEIFVNGESREYCPVFLWHVAHIIRAAMLTVKGVQLPIKKAVSGSESLDTDSKDSATTQGPVPVGESVAMSTVPVATMITSADGIHHAVPTSFPQLVPAQQRNRPSPPAQNQMLDPAEASLHPSTAGHRAPTFPGQYPGGPDTIHSALRVSRTRPGRSASGAYNQSMSYVENLPRAPSGPGHRQYAGPLSMIQSPRYNQAQTVLNQPMGNAHYGLAPVAYEQALMPSGMVAVPPQAHGVVHPSMISHQPIRNPSISHGHPRQTSGPQGVPFAMPMGDMTNLPYDMGIPPHQFGSPHPGDSRFNQQYTNGNALYDPYDGNNPAFRAPGYFNGNSKKNNPSGSYYSNGRQRKSSLMGSRPHQGQFESDRSGPPQMNARRPAGLKSHFENDLAITQDQEHGCSENWIGPQNETVNELYVKDLPANVEAAELEAMFHGRLGVKPTSVNVKGAFNAPGGRKHAFVGFSSTSIAKQGIIIRDATIRGLPVSITVPRRFFQKTVDVSSRDVVDVGPSPYSRFTANPNNGDGRNRKASLNNGGSTASSATAAHEAMSYSPQDARSDLHKKKKGKQSQQGSATAGSPEARKTKPKKRQESPVKEIDVESAVIVSNDAPQQHDKVDDLVTTRVSAPENRCSDELQSQQPEDREAMLTEDHEATVPAMTDEQQIVEDVSRGKEVHDATEEVVSIASNERQSASMDHLMLQAQLSDETGVMEGQDLAKPSINMDTAAEQGPSTMVHLDPEKKTAAYHETSSSIDAAEKSQTGLMAKAEPEIGSEEANQGPPSTLSLASIEASPSLLPLSQTEAATKSPLFISEAAVVPIATFGDPIVGDTEPAAMPSLNSQVVEAPTTSHKDSKIVTASASSLEPVKKSGAQHTESLHPFSKQSKAQAKKEREQKKKAQRREREQAEKAKAAKTAASKASTKTLPEPEGTLKTKASSETVPIEDAEAKAAAQDEPTEERTGALALEDAQLPTEGNITEEMSAQTPTSSVVSVGGDADIRKKSSKRKGKKTSTSNNHEMEATKEGNEDHGKQTGGTVSVLSELSSVTNKEVKVKLPEEAPASDVQSSEPVHTDDASGAAKVVRFAEEPTPAAKKKRKTKPKKKKKAPAWPNFEFRPKTSNPSWMGPIDMAADVRNYDEIMDRACGGEEDSDFSWSDLPEVEDEMDYDEEELDEGDEDGEKDLDAIQTRIAELQKQQASTSSGLSHNAAEDAVKPETAETGDAIGEAVVDSAIATLQTQIAATNDEIDAAYENIDRLEKSAGSGPTSTTAASASKKKKPNNRKNKKKKKAAEAAQTDLENAFTESQSSKTVGDLVDSNDPFYDQLKEIEETKRGVQDTPSLRGGHAEATKSHSNEPQLMRTMEAYFKETQGDVQPKGRKM